MNDIMAALGLAQLDKLPSPGYHPSRRESQFPSRIEVPKRPEIFRAMRYAPRQGAKYTFDPKRFRYQSQTLLEEEVRE